MSSGNESSSGLETLNALVSRAEALLQVRENETIEVFVDQIGDYLASFQVWESELKESNPLAEDSSLSADERAHFEKQVLKLNELHGQILEFAEHCRKAVSTQLGDLHKRAGALKKYIDRYPARITIAGKREG